MNSFLERHHEKKNLFAKTTETTLTNMAQFHCKYYFLFENLDFVHNQQIVKLGNNQFSEDMLLVSSAVKISQSYNHCMKA